LNGPGPAIAGGMVFVESGYAANGMPGSVLLDAAALITEARSSALGSRRWGLMDLFSAPAPDVNSRTPEILLVS